MNKIYLIITFCLCTCLLGLVPIAVQAQTIVAAEYFWETDPGLGNGTPLNIGASADSININATITANGVQPGLRILFIRMRYSNGKWSLAEPKLMSVDYGGSYSTITAGEYFWNTDPGLGNATPLNIGIPNDTLNVNINVSATGLQPGVHLLFTRYRSNNGRWSIAEPYVISVDYSAVVSTITAAEYFLDTDPGLGSATAASLTYLNDTARVQSIVIPTSATEGQHKLFMRFKNSVNKWSLAELIGTITVSVGAVVVTPIADQTLIEGFGSTTIIDLDNVFNTGNTYAVWDDNAQVTTSIGAGGVLNVSAPANFSGIVNITITATNTNGTSVQEMFVLTISNVNDQPTAANDSGSTPEDNPLNISPITNDSDIDGDAIGISAITQPTQGGTVTQNGNTLTFTPTANYNGTVTFTYTVSDGNGGTATATVTINVTSVNDQPIAQSDNATTNEDTPITITPLTNDSDIESVNLTIANVSQPTQGGTVGQAGGNLTFTPTANYNGTVTFTYTVSDGNGGTATATVTINVTSVNDQPIAQNDNVSTPENTPINITPISNDSDVDGNTLSVESITQPTQGGTVVQNGNTLTFTPDNGFDGTATFSYTISDGNGGTATAMVNITVSNINIAPIAQNDNLSTDEDTPITVTPLSNDSDPDGSTLSISGITQPTQGGMVVQNGNTLNFTPTANYSGTVTFSYTISDGGLTATATVTITVNAIEDAPTPPANPSGPVAGTTLPDLTSPVPFTWSAATDVECGNDITYQVVLTDPSGAITTIDAGSNTQININPSGLLPNTVYTWTIVATDCNGETTASTPSTFTTPDAVGIDDVLTPNSLWLGQNTPNPYNSTTQISFYLPQSSQIVLSVYDVSGKLVKAIFSGYQTAGTHQLLCDNANLPSGTYLYTLKVGNKSLSRRMVVVGE